MLVPLDESPDVLGMVVCAFGRRPNRNMITANWAFHTAPAVGTRRGRDDLEMCGNRVVQGSADLFAGVRPASHVVTVQHLYRGRGDHAPRGGELVAVDRGQDRAARWPVLRPQQISVRQTRSISNGWPADARPAAAGPALGRAAHPRPGPRRGVCRAGRCDRLPGRQDQATCATS